MPTENENLEYVQLRITESFSRVLENWNSETSQLSLEARNGHYILIFKHSDEPDKYFKVADDPAVKEYYPLACCENSGYWEHVGSICKKLRMTANDESFDQVRQSLVKVDQVSRKTNFPSWNSVGETTLKRNAPKSSRNKVPPLKTAPLASRRTPINDSLAPKSIPRLCQLEIPDNSGFKVLPQSTGSLERLPENARKLVTSAKNRRQILERRLATIYDDAKLSIPERLLQIEKVKSDLFVLVDELLACKELTTSVPPSANVEISNKN